MTFRSIAKILPRGMLLFILLGCHQLGAAESTATQYGVAGYQIENSDESIQALPAVAPSLVRERYWFGFFTVQHDWNKDGYRDVLYAGTKQPDNLDPTGDNTGGLCGSEACGGYQYGPTLYLGGADGQYTLADGLFRDDRAVPGQSLARQLLVADYNDDGVLDLFIADHGVGTHKGVRDSYYLSQPDGTWLESSATHLSPPEFVIFDHGAATGDIDNDGDADIVMTNLATGGLTCWHNDGTGMMSLRQCGRVNAFGIELGDFDGDGDLDLLHGGHEYEHSTQTGIAYNNGKGYFTPKIRFGKVKEYPTIPEVAVYDVDADGDLDAVISRAGVLYVGTAVELLLNESTGTGRLRSNSFRSVLFELVDAPDSYVPSHEGNEWNHFVDTIRFSDVDQDGDTDIVLRGGNPSLDYGRFVIGAILRQEAPGTFRHIPQGDAGNPITITSD
ncbi:MAG: VCBS repeat-containing protein, partial [Alphaproteobacteria bacterium]|nr:VCBS repeat-containing protein [Alphaproteobacteria bacterium]